MLQAIALIPGRFIFGNISGFSNNLSSRLRMCKMRWSTKKWYRSRDFTPEVKVKSKLLRENGFVSFTNHASQSNSRGTDLNKRVAEQFEQLLNDPAQTIGSKNGEIIHIINPVYNIPEIKELIPEEVLHTIEDYFKTPLKVKAVRAWRNNHVNRLDENKTDVFSNTWHNDNYPYWGVKLFWIVSDTVDRRSGAFRFHSIESSKSIARKIGFFHRSKITNSVKSLLLSDASIQYFEGKIGDICICNTQACLHAASNPEKGLHRDIVQFEIIPNISVTEGYEKLMVNLDDDRGELTKVFNPV